MVSNYFNSLYDHSNLSSNSYELPTTNPGYPTYSRECSDHIIRVRNYGLARLNELKEIHHKFNACEENIRRATKKFNTHACLCKITPLFLITFIACNILILSIYQDPDTRIQTKIAVGTVCNIVIGMFVLICGISLKDRNIALLKSERRDLIHRSILLCLALGRGWPNDETPNENWLANQIVRINYFDNSLFLQLMSEVWTKRFINISWEGLEAQEIGNGILHKTLSTMFFNPFVSETYRLIEHYIPYKNELLMLSREELDRLRMPRVLLELIIEYLKTPELSFSVEYFCNDIPISFATLLPIEQPRLA